MRLNQPRSPQSIMLWYGGKSRLLAWICPLLRPMLADAQTYVEPYVGGASVWLALHPRLPCEVLNDRDEQLIAFYRAVQSPDYPRLWKQARAVPYARRAFQQDHACPQHALWIHQTQGISGTPANNTGSWGRAFIPRFGVSCRVSYYLKSMRMLSVLHHRLQSVQLHCADALDIIPAYDSPRTVFYLDPPYPHHTRISDVVYRYEADDAHHHTLVETLLHIQGKAVLSGYPTPYYTPLEQHGWRRLERAVQTTASVPKRKGYRNRTEVVWYKP